MSECVVELLRRARQDPLFRETLLQAAPGDLAALGLKPGQQAVLLSNLLLTEPFWPKDLPDWDRRYGDAFSWVDLRQQAIPWTPFKRSIVQATVSFITTAGIHRREDPPFQTQDEERGDPSYRVIPSATPPDALRVRHHLVLVVVNSANVRRFLRRMGGASARNMGIDLANLRKMA